MRPTIEELRVILICDAVTGRLVWKARTPEMFAGKNPKRYCQTWNSRYAGTDAGHECKVDGEPTGYRTIRIFDQSFLVHHVVWAIVHGEWPEQLDHRDGVEKGDGIDNLRIATQSQNMANTRKRGDNQSGFKGVSWDSTNKKWVARIRQPEGKYENLGRFIDPSEAHQAYCRRAKELYGEFARFA